MWKARVLLAELEADPPPPTSSGPPWEPLSHVSHAWAWPSSACLQSHPPLSRGLTCVVAVHVHQVPNATPEPPYGLIGVWVVITGASILCPVHPLPVEGQLLSLAPGPNLHQGPGKTHIGFPGHLVACRNAGHEGGEGRDLKLCVNEGTHGVRGPQLVGMCGCHHVSAGMWRTWCQRPRHALWELLPLTVQHIYCEPNRLWSPLLMYHLLRLADWLWSPLLTWPCQGLPCYRLTAPTTNAPHPCVTVRRAGLNPITPPLLPTSRYSPPT